MRTAQAVEPPILAHGELSGLVAHAACYCPARDAKVLQWNVDPTYRQRANGLAECLGAWPVETEELTRASAHAEGLD